LIYYREHLYFRKHHSYALSLKQLEINSTVVINNKTNQLTLEATKHLFMGLIRDVQNSTGWTINQQSEIGNY
jgi:hypothetical protein